MIWCVLRDGQDPALKMHRAAVGTEDLRRFVLPVFDRDVREARVWPEICNLAAPEHELRSPRQPVGVSAQIERPRHYLRRTSPDDASHDSERSAAEFRQSAVVHVSRQRVRGDADVTPGRVYLRAAPADHRRKPRRHDLARHPSVVVRMRHQHAAVHVQGRRDGIRIAPATRNLESRDLQHAAVEFNTTLSTLGPRCAAKPVEARVTSILDIVRTLARSDRHSQIPCVENRSVFDEERSDSVMPPVAADVHAAVDRYVQLHQPQGGSLRHRAFALRAAEVQIRIHRNRAVPQNHLAVASPHPHRARRLGAPSVKVHRRRAAGIIREDGLGDGVRHVACIISFWPPLPVASVPPIGT